MAAPGVAWSNIRSCLVKTKPFVCIVDEQVEMCQEVLAEKSANAGIGGVDLSKVVDDGEWLFDHVGAASKLSNMVTDARAYLSTEIRPPVPWDFSPSSKASTGSITVTWLPVSTIKS